LAFVVEAAGLGAASGEEVCAITGAAIALAKRAAVKIERARFIPF